MIRVWDLEREGDKLMKFVVGRREKRATNVRGAVESIKNEVIAKGDEALFAFSRKWDGWKKNIPLRVSMEEIEEGARSVGKEDLVVLRGMIKNIRAFHRGQKPKNRTYREENVLVAEEFIPVEKAMVYVPGGTAPYPSSLIMGAVPAKIAGVQNILVATPAKEGKINPYILAAAHLAGVDGIYRIGGAQAIYAFSYGTRSIPTVDIIVGPGNAYVEEAKRDVYGRVGIDMLAGPTELIVLCTEAGSAEMIARDIFSQAEHDEMAVVGVFSPDKRFLRKVVDCVQLLADDNERKEIIGKSIETNSFFVYYKDAESAIEMINRIAPEHMELIGDEGLAKKLLYPGILYVGPHTPVAMGDYYIGTNHVLPTSGAGRFTGGLSVDTFMRRKTTVKLKKGFIEKYGEKAIRLSQIEGLYAHGEAIKIRKEQKNEA